MQGNWLIAALGLCWPRQVLPVLKQQVIFVSSSIRPQRKHLAGGCLPFTHEDGQPIEWVHPVKAIGANGPHTVVVVAVFSRQMFTVLSSRQRPPSVLAPQSRLSRQQQQPR